MNEIELPEFRIAQAAMYDAESKLEAAQEKLNAYQEFYSRYKRMRKVCDKELPFKEILDEIDSITVEAGRKAIVHWL